jgi:glycerol dehydrogenase-like iron-containing ADH family enzyme
MHETFYTVCFKDIEVLNSVHFPVTNGEIRIEEMSIKENILLLEVNCTPRELIKYLAETLGEDVDSVGLIIRNETFEPDWSKTYEVLA